MQARPGQGYLQPTQGADSGSGMGGRPGGTSGGSQSQVLGSDESENGDMQ